MTKINPMKLNSYFSFMRDAKSANSKLFKDFRNEAEMEKNSQIVGFILSSSLSVSAVQSYNAVEQTAKKYRGSSPVLYMLPPDNAVLTQATNYKTQLPIRGAKKLLFIFKFSNHHIFKLPFSFFILSCSFFIGEILFNIV